METEPQRFKKTHKKKEASGNLETEQVEAAKAFLSSISLTSTKPIPIKNSQNILQIPNSSTSSPNLSNSQIRKEEEKKTIHSNPRLTQSNFPSPNESNTNEQNSPSTPGKELRTSTTGIDIPVKRSQSENMHSPNSKVKVSHSSSADTVSSNTYRSDTEAMHFLKGISLNGPTVNENSPRDLKKRMPSSASLGTPMSVSAEIPNSQDNSHHDLKVEREHRTSMSSYPPSEHISSDVSTSPRNSISSAPPDLQKLNRPLFKKKESKKKLKEPPDVILKNYIQNPENSRIVFTKVSKNSRGKSSKKSYPIVVYSMITRYDSIYVSRPTLHVHTGATSVTNSGNSNANLSPSISTGTSPTLPIPIPPSLQSHSSTPTNNSPSDIQLASHAIPHVGPSTYEMVHVPSNRDSLGSSASASQPTSAHHFYHPHKSKGISYAHLLNATWTTHLSSDNTLEDIPLEKPKDAVDPFASGQSAPEENNKETSAQEQSAEGNMYDPDFIDDPELTTGKHRTVLNLPSFRETIIPFVKPSELKEELNDQFKQRHPWINPGVTLFKIRSLKRNLLLIAKSCNIEVSSLALSYVFLDKLLMKNEIFKETLKLYGATALLLATKFNDQLPSSNSGVFKHILEAIEKILGVTPKEVMQAEFDVFAKLSFALFVDPKEVIPHTQRLQPHFSYHD